MEPLVTSTWLAAHLDEVRPVDCRFDLRDPDAGRRRYRQGHLPGAAYLDLATDLSAPPGGRDGGRHPLPDRTAFGASIRRAGVSAGTTVVAYDDDGRSGGAARLWWLLRHWGHDDVVVLAGGFAAWEGPVEDGEPSIPAGDFSPAPVPRDDTVTAEDIVAGFGHLLLLDARAPERYRGEVEPFDAVAGHIPGAVNVPHHDPGALDAAGLGGPALDEAPQAVAYCGSGVTAAVLLLDLAARGHHARLYPGSWSEWSARGLPVEAG